MRSFTFSDRPTVVGVNVSPQLRDKLSEVPFGIVPSHSLPIEVGDDFAIVFKESDVLSLITRAFNQGRNHQRYLEQEEGN